MRILFLSDNFPPETNAPATRTFEHTRRWVRAGAKVTVVTTQPNFPAGKLFPGYRNRLFQREWLDGVEVIRVWSYITANEGVGTPWYDRTSFARDLSRQIASVRGSEPVYGMPSISRMAGICDSREEPPIPSAMLKTISGRKS